MGNARSSSYFGSTITTGDDTTDVQVPANESYTLKLGDNAGATSWSLLDSDGVSVASIDSNGGVAFSGGSFLADDISLKFGNTAASPNVQMLWETADANANAFILSLPTGGGTDVPVLAIGDTSLIN